MNAFLGIEYFANPEALWLLLSIPIYLFWYLRFYARKRLLIRLSYDPLSFRPPRVNLSFLRFVPRALQLLTIALIILALARPQAASDVIEQKTEGIDIMLLLDTSGSMETEDFSPNRLAVAKQTANAFIQGRPDDRIGLVLFAEDALSYVPLTLDHELLSRQIKLVHSEILPKQGTAIGPAIAVGINRLRGQAPNSRVMILMTDGANNRGKIDPITAAKLAAQHGIRIYCIGIGKETYLKSFPLGGKRQVQSDLDEETLIKVASLTNGTFFRSTNAQGLQAIFRQISELETDEQAEKLFREVVDLYPRFVQLAIICAFFAFLSMLTFMYNPLEQ